MLHLQASHSLLLIIDMQTSLLPSIANGERVTATVRRLAQAARLLEVPVIATEHYSHKIGKTVEDLSGLAAWTLQKTHFDATREPDFLTRLGRMPSDAPAASGRFRLLLTGVEAHICVLQTGLGLKQAGFEPVLVMDATGSRSPENHKAAIARWHYHGLETVTSEMAMYEWLETPEHPRFRDVLALVKAG